MLKKLREQLYFDKVILVLYILLSLFGLLMSYSASSYYGLTEMGSSEYFLVRQMMFVLLGIGIVIALNVFGEKILKKKILLFAAYGVLIVLLLFVLTRTATNGAKSWIQIPLFGTLQPSEFAKMIIIWSGAFFYSTSQQLLKQSFWKYVQYPLAMAVPIFLLVMIQPDLGTNIILVGTFILLLACSGVALYVLYGTGALVATGYLLTFLPATWIQSLPFLKSYQLLRLVSFHDPWQYKETGGYQLIQGFYALARGGLTGTGLATSVQKTGFLPEAHTDFILAIVGEELGLVVILLVLAALFALVLLILKRGMDCQLLFAKLLCMGVGIVLLIQLSINIGALVGVAPLTGVPLPLISYGGSSFITTSIGIGFVQCALKMDARVRKQNAK